MLKNRLSNTWVVILLATVCCFLWGSAFPCIKIGYRLFSVENGDSAAQILFAGLRFALAGIMVIAVFSVMRKKFVKPAAPGKILTLSLFQTIGQYVPFYIGLANTTGVKSSIINGTGVFLTILVACLIFHQEKLTDRKILGSLLGFAGVLIINMSGASIDLNVHFIGEGLIVLSALSSAFSSAFIKKFSTKADVVMLSGYQFFVGGIIMMLCGFAMGGRLKTVSPPAIMLLLYMGFISAAAYTIWSILLKHNDVSRVSVYKFMNPLFGALLSYLLLKEESLMGGRTVAALILVCAGIYVVNMKDKSSKKA